MLSVNIRLIRGVWHAEVKVGGRWKVTTFDHKPTPSEALYVLRG